MHEGFYSEKKLKNKKYDAGLVRFRSGSTDANTSLATVFTNNICYLPTRFALRGITTSLEPVKKDINN